MTNSAPTERWYRRARLGKTPWLVGLLALAGVGAAIAVVVSNGQQTDLHLGRFAGYIWDQRPVREVGAEWIVPAIARGSDDGRASTWVGVEEPPSGAAYAFLQVGTDEQQANTDLGHRTAYFAFWSDAAHHSRAQQLFQVNPGDRIHADLRLGAGHWQLTISDVTSRKNWQRADVDAPGRALATAQWIQEDVAETLQGRPSPYPHLENVVLSGMSVDSDVPDETQSMSEWMELPGRAMAPTPIQHGSFVVRPVHLTHLASKYVVFARRRYVAFRSFTSAATPQADGPSAHVVTSAATKLFSALRASDHAFASGIKSAAILDAVARVSASDLKLERCVDSVVGRGASGVLSACAQRSEDDTENAYRLADEVGAPQSVPSDA